MKRVLLTTPILAILVASIWYLNERGARRAEMRWKMKTDVLKAIPALFDYTTIIDSRMGDGKYLLTVRQPDERWKNYEWFEQYKTEDDLKESRQRCNDRSIRNLIEAGHPLVIRVLGEHYEELERFEFTMRSCKQIRETPRVDRK